MIDQNTPCTDRLQSVTWQQAPASTLVPMTHDWRLWERKRLFHFGVKPGEGRTAPFVTETWYCCRCRHVETREVAV